ncbi:MAG TPA: 30S ribosomal protein S6 [Candidatus Saccharibacteria bacterium]|nr:30S ribosomal protein S6 [Candidatus Saccharibacteria bacterium]
MREYELTVLIHPDLEADLETPLKVVRDIVTSNKGTITSEDNWGKKRLAYRIAKEDFAVYVHMVIQLPPENVAKVDTTLNITDSVLRHLLVSEDPKAKAAAAEAASKKSEESEEE